MKLFVMTWWELCCSALLAAAENSSDSPSFADYHISYVQKNPPHNQTLWVQHYEFISWVFFISICWSKSFFILFYFFKFGNVRIHCKMLHHFILPWSTHLAAECLKSFHVSKINTYSCSCTCVCLFLNEGMNSWPITKMRWGLCWNFTFIVDCNSVLNWLDFAQRAEF